MANEPLLTKDAINIGGHKFPIALVGGLAAVATVILIIRSRSQGATVSAGSVPASAASPYAAAVNGFGAQGFTPDYSGALANISQELTSLSQTGINSSTQASTFQVASGNPNWAPAPGSGWGGAPGQLPLYSASVPGGITWVPSTTPLQVVGGPDASGGIPVNYLGHTYDIAPPEWSISSSPQQPATYRAPGT